jgi:outer membrane protein assembly factor BamA
MQICWVKRIECLFVTILCWISLAAQPRYFVSDIQITGNKVTKTHIILRELDLKKGDSVLVSRIALLINNSKENLENLSLFNFVNVGYHVIPQSENHIAVTISLDERWYYLPLISIKPEDRNTSSWIKHFDMSRITFEVGAQLYNLFGLNHTITSGFEIGYRQGVNFHYKNFTLDRAQKHFLSAGISIQRSHNIDVMTIDDAPLQLKVADQFLTQNIRGYFNYTYRHDVRRTHNVSFGYEYKKIADTIIAINSHYWGNQRRERMNMNLQYFFRVDQRDYIPYPLRGYFLKTEGNIFVTNDLSVRYAQVRANAQYYLPLGNRWFAAGKMTAGASVKNTKAYILDKALGYGEDVLRGYEYHVVDGQYFTSVNTTLRFTIIPKKIFVINWLSALSKFNKIHYALYSHTFVDMGIAFHQYPDLSNHLSNQFLYSGGVGLDLVTYYDIVFTLSFSMNKQREHGVYFSFKLPFM